MRIRTLRQSEPQAQARGCLRGPARFARIAPAFTLIELLVVVAILVLLAGLIASGASRLFSQQKIRATQQAMSNMLLAIDNFSKEDPLRLTYDRRDDPTFGPFPPYMLANRFVTDSAAEQLFDPLSEFGGQQGNYTLDYRLGRDLGDRQPPINGPTEWVSTSSRPGSVVDDDNRSLFAYLAGFSRSSLSLIPERNRFPLTNDDEYISPRGRGRIDPSDRIELHGFVDAWGVPIDYFINVKVQWGTIRDNFGIVRSGYRIVDRAPVLRSRGVDREKYDQWVSSNPTNPSQRSATLLDPSRQIFSSELPRPYAQTTDANLNVQRGILPLSTGSNQAPSMRAGGWLSLVAGGPPYDGPQNAYQDDPKYRSD